MKLIFLYGLPATGKLTVARELAAITGYKLFHNHLAVDLLLPVFPFGSASFIELREQIWLSVFDHACRGQVPGLIFTFAPEKTVRPDFIRRMLTVIARNHSQAVFIELVCPLAELKRRIVDPSRRQYGKLASVPLFDKLMLDGVFDGFPMPEPALSVDTSRCKPRESATLIARLLGVQPPQ